MNIHSGNMASVILFELPWQMNVGIVASVLSVEVPADNHHRMLWCRELCIQHIKEIERVCCAFWGFFFFFFPPLTDVLRICAVSDCVCQDGGVLTKHLRVRLGSEKSRQIDGGNTALIATSFFFGFPEEKRKRKRPLHLWCSSCCTANEKLYPPRVTMPTLAERDLLQRPSSLSPPPARCCSHSHMSSGWRAMTGWKRRHFSEWSG